LAALRVVTTTWRILEASAARARSALMSVRASARKALAAAGQSRPGKNGACPMDTRKPEMSSLYLRACAYDRSLLALSKDPVSNVALHIIPLHEICGVSRGRHWNNDKSMRRLLCTVAPLPVSQEPSEDTEARTDNRAEDGGAAHTGVLFKTTNFFILELRINMAAHLGRGFFRRGGLSLTSLSS